MLARHTVLATLSRPSVMDAYSPPFDAELDVPGCGEFRVVNTPGYFASREVARR